MPEPSRSNAGDDDDVALLAAELTELVSRMSTESRFHLRTALGASQYPVGGDLVIQIPRRSSEHVVARWVGGGLSGLFGKLGL